MKKLPTAFFKIIFAIVFINLSLAWAQTAQIPLDAMLEITRAEDELRFDDVLRQLIKSPAAAVRQRAALAAGRIGNQAAIAPLVELLEKDQSIEVRTTAVFALGEIENIAAADQVLKILTTAIAQDGLRARALEAAGKIAAANQPAEKLPNEKAVELGETILDVLEAEFLKPARDRDTVLLGLTAALRAKPKESEFVIGKFLSDKDARVRADALNALVRLRAKNDDLKNQYRALLIADDDAVVRANAARAIGAGEDKDSIELLTEAANSDDDARVRVAAIRALANLNDRRAATPLLERADKLFAVYKTAKSRKIANPVEKNELLEIAQTLGKLLANSNDEKARLFLMDFRAADNFASPEIDVSLARIAAQNYFEQIVKTFGESLSENARTPARTPINWRKISSVAQGAGELATAQFANADNARAETLKILRAILANQVYATVAPQALPDVLRAFAQFKTDDLPLILRAHLRRRDVIERATAAELLGDQAFDRINLGALAEALRVAERADSLNDAALATLDALKKQQDKTEPNDFIAQEILSNSFQLAVQSPDYLVRRRADAVLNTTDETEPNQDFIEFPAVPNAKSLNLSRSFRTNYVRALFRTNAWTKAVVTTQKGVFTINLLPEAAPLTVDNFVRLAQTTYFNNTEFHRVVPNFVVQGGDPRGDGNGNPGFAIRDEINFESYERGAVGMALSGKDTGGSQWFVTHSPQPHLDGGYTIFGRVSEADMKIVDKITRGDRILSIRIIQGNNQLPRTAVKPQRKPTKINAANQPN